jgi:NAD(P)-dependent dehydrogenase (short-subunit alcohol dehydrogenase family)
MTGRRLLEGQYAVVTGASRGIGRAISEVLAEHGSSIALTARNLQGCRDAATELSAKFHTRTLAIATDVSVRESVRASFKEVLEWSSGRLDTLICNAGYPFAAEIWNTPLDQTPNHRLEEWYTGVFRTDVLGSIFCTFEALPTMMRRNCGSIIYVSSTPALEGLQGTPYTVGKAAVLGLMKDVANQYGRFNVRANALALGSILTSATLNEIDPETEKRFAAEAPLRRWGTPEEVGHAVLFLASNLSSFMTGQTLVLDGGRVRR